MCKDYLRVPQKYSPRKICPSGQRQLDDVGSQSNWLIFRGAPGNQLDVAQNHGTIVLPAEFSACTYIDN